MGLRAVAVIDKILVIFRLHEWFFLVPARALQLVTIFVHQHISFHADCNSCSTGWFSDFTSRYVVCVFVVGREGGRGGGGGGGGGLTVSNTLVSPQ